MQHTRPLLSQRDSGDALNAWFIVGDWLGQVLASTNRPRRVLIKIIAPILNSFRRTAATKAHASAVSSNRRCRIVSINV